MTADDEILQAFGCMRDKTLELLAGVAEECLERKAEGERLALAGVFHHIAGADAWWMHRVMKDGCGMAPPAEGLGKEQIAALLRGTRGRILSFFSQPEAMDRPYDYPRPDGQTRPLSGRWCLLYLLQHEVHHRGKIVLTLRQWGINSIPFLPYSGWE